MGGLAGLGVHTESSVYHSIPREKEFSESIYPAAETVGTVGNERAPRAVFQALCEEGENF